MLKLCHPNLGVSMKALLLVLASLTLISYAHAQIKISDFQGKWYAEDCETKSPDSPYPQAWSLYSISKFQDLRGAYLEIKLNQAKKTIEFGDNNFPLNKLKFYPIPEKSPFVMKQDSCYEYWGCSHDKTTLSTSISGRTLNLTHRYSYPYVWPFLNGHTQRFKISLSANKKTLTISATQAWDRGIFKTTCVLSK
jgi:hypothetical protein